MLSVASKQPFPWSVLPYLSIREFASGAHHPAFRSSWPDGNFTCLHARVWPNRYRNTIPVRETLQETGPTRQPLRLRAPAPEGMGTHSQAQHKERDTSTGHILGPVVNGCTSCRLCGRQNGKGELSEFVMRQCTSRDQDLRYEVMCRILREPHPGGPRDKWKQRSLKSFFVPSVDTVSDDVLGNPAL